MDPVKKLAKLFWDFDPIKLKSTSNTNEYIFEAELFAKEMQYVRTVEKLAILLHAVFTKSFDIIMTKSINWKPLADIIFKDEELKKLIGRLS